MSDQWYCDICRSWVPQALSDYVASACPECLARIQAAENEQRQTGPPD